MKSIINANALCMGDIEAPAFIIKRQKSDIKLKKTQNIDTEISKIQIAYDSIINKVNELYQKMDIIWNSEAKEIFGAFVMLLNDKTFMDNPIKLVKENNYTSEYAIYKTIRTLMDTFRQIDSQYIRERINDLDEIGYYLINYIYGFTINQIIKNNEPFILVAHKIGCIDLAILGKKNIKGIIAQSNMEYTHAILIAKTENIPIVVGAENILETVSNNEIIKIHNSQIIVN